MKAEDVLRPGAPQKRILVAGDGLIDVYSHGRLESCQDGCVKFVEESRHVCDGGAMNAEKSLSYVAEADSDGIPVFEEKRRELVDGKIVHRSDMKFHVPEAQVRACRDNAMSELEEADAVYLADYAKGFFTDALLRSIIARCNERGVPVVADPKRDPNVVAGAILKCNAEFTQTWGGVPVKHFPGTVVTRNSEVPLVGKCDSPLPIKDFLARRFACVSHVGAGDCFGAWLTLGLAHGLVLEEAARLAHAAGRVYVQHLHNRAPWPHEVRRELDPVMGKVLLSGEDAALRESCPGRVVVFTNGVFRIPGPGHFWLFDWAKRQGDVLVVGVNDDVSAFRQKHGQFVMPLAERLQMIASCAAVDYVVPFTEDTPVDLMMRLKPDLAVKGAEYSGRPVPGSDLCELWVAPPSPFRSHVSDLVKAIRG